MDFLNKTVAQFNDLFHSMTPGARITAGLLSAVVVISLVYLFSYQVSSSDTYLMNGKAFKPGELARVQAALGEKKLSCTADGMRVLIPRGREAEYMAALAEEGALPRDWNNAGEGAIGSSTFESSDSRKARIKLNLEERLSFIVSEFEEVENAQVIFDKTTEGGWRKRVITSAAVSVSTVGGRELTENAVNGIRNLISGALPPMKPEDVKVVNVSTCTSYFGDNGAKSGMHGNNYLKLTHDWEEEYTNKILRLLSDIPGVKARMTVKLDTVESLSAKKITPDNKGTAVMTTEKEITREQEGAVPNGRPGSVANQAMAIRGGQARGSMENEGESESTTTNIVGGVTEDKKMVGMTPVWMAATVIVPHSYLVNVWKQENPIAAGEEAKTPAEKDLLPIEQKVVARIQENVANLLPPEMTNVADKSSLVTVTVSRDIKPDPLPEPSMASGVVAWLSENWGTVGLIVLAFASLGMLRSMVRSTSVEPQSRPQSQPSLTMETAGVLGGESGESETSKAQRRLANFAKGGASLRDELSDLVKEDPDAAANILRTWIGTPSIKA